MSGLAGFLAGIVVGPIIYIAAEIGWSWIQYWRTPRWRR